MRIVKVRIRAGDVKAGEDQMVYPARYNAIEVDQKGGGTVRLGGVGITYSGELGRGGSEEFLYIVLPDALALEYAEDPNMMIMDSITADTELETNRVNNNVSENQIDDIILNAITAKQVAGIPLTRADLNALDPDNPEKGITKARKPTKKSVPDIDDDLTTIPANKKEIQRG